MIFEAGIGTESHTCAPLTMDWNPDPHSLLTVRAGTDTGMSDLRAICLARYISPPEVCGHIIMCQCSSIQTEQYDIISIVYLCSVYFTYGILYGTCS